MTLKNATMLLSLYFTSMVRKIVKSTKAKKDNAEAQRRFRERRKQELEALTYGFEHLENENSRLKSENAQLKVKVSQQEIVDSELNSNMRSRPTQELQSMSEMLQVCDTNLDPCEIYDSVSSLAPAEASSPVDCISVKRTAPTRLTSSSVESETSMIDVLKSEPVPSVKPVEQTTTSGLGPQYFTCQSIDQDWESVLPSIECESSSQPVTGGRVSQIEDCNLDFSKASSDQGLDWLGSEVGCVDGSIGCDNFSTTRSLVSGSCKDSHANISADFQPYNENTIQMMDSTCSTFTSQQHSNSAFDTSAQYGCYIPNNGQLYPYAPSPLDQVISTIIASSGSMDIKCKTLEAIKEIYKLQMPMDTTSYYPATTPFGLLPSSAPLQQNTENWI